MITFRDVRCDLFATVPAPAASVEASARRPRLVSDGLAVDRERSRARASTTGSATENDTVPCRSGGAGGIVTRKDCPRRHVQPSAGHVTVSSLAATDGTTRARS